MAHLLPVIDAVALASGTSAGHCQRPAQGRSVRPGRRPARPDNAGVHLDSIA